MPKPTSYFIIAINDKQGDITNRIDPRYEINRTSNRFIVAVCNILTRIIYAERRYSHANNARRKACKH